MNDDVIRATLADAEAAVRGYISACRDETSGIRRSVRGSCIFLQDEISIRIASEEILLIRVTALLIDNATYHILRAYHHASPSLWLFLVGLYKLVTVIIGIINMINKTLMVITGQTLAYWLNKLIPGFQDVWNDIMNKISAFSGALGWGVDGVHHLLNIANTSADLWGTLKGKDRSSINIERYARLDYMLNSYSNDLQLWQENPGQQLANMEAMMSTRTMTGVSGIMNGITDKLGAFGATAEAALGGLGAITDELLAMRNDMPAFIANNIPQGLWDGIEKVDTVINDRILPALTDITDRIDELDAVIESYQKKAAEIAERLAHPGDLLAEIDKLPDYARQNQLVKIDGVTSTLIREENEAAFADVSADLRNFGLVAAALASPPAPLAFMTLELPGRSPGITPEPYETWFVGDY